MISNMAERAVKTPAKTVTVLRFMRSSLHKPFVKRVAQPKAKYKSGQCGYYCPTPAKVKLAGHVYRNDLRVEVAMNQAAGLRTVR
jgi:hypothetical protein